MAWISTSALPIVGGGGCWWVVLWTLDKVIERGGRDCGETVWAVKAWRGGW